MLEPGSAQKRTDIPYFEGVNSLVSFNIAKKTELVHAENARSKTIGTVEKREGQTVLGTNVDGEVFKTAANWGLFSFQNANNKGFYRISDDQDPSLLISTSRSPSASVSRSISPSASGSSSQSPSSSISSSQSPSSSVSPSSSASTSPSSSVSPSTSLSPSSSVSPSASLSVSVSPSASVSPSSSLSPSASVSRSVSPSASVSPSSSSSLSPSASVSRSVSPSASTSPVASGATIYYLSNTDRWTPLTGYGTNITGAQFDYTYAEGNAFLTNLYSDNRYITSDGTTVVTSSDATGHLYNAPRASLVNFYKNRLYLADFEKTGVRYKTTILRSSYPMGIIALVNNDYTALASGSTIEVTDTKYFYTDPGANSYDVYRGNTLITVITLTVINTTSIVATWSGTPDFLASDEIWISGTYTGAKVFRWVNNPTITGKDIKQYDTFKLAGGENDPTTMMVNIGNVMMVSNKTTLMTWNDYTLENFDLDIGCVSKNGYIKTLGTLYFLHYTGIYATSGSTPQLVSNKIEKYINGATKAGKEASAAGRKGRSIFFTLGDVTLYRMDGSVNKVLPDVCVEYNLVQENWFVHTNVKASEFATYIEALDSDRLEFTDTGGVKAVKEFLSGDTDDGTEINFRIDTTKLTLQPNNFEYSSKPVALLIETERGAAIKSFVNFENDEEYYPLEGTIVKGLSVIKVGGRDNSRGVPPYARLMSVSLRDSSKQLCKVSRMAISAIPTTEEDMDNE